AARTREFNTIHKIYFVYLQQRIKDQRQCRYFFFSSRRRHTRSVSAFLLNRSSDLSRSSYFATFRHQLTILSKTDALDEEKWLNMLGTFVKDWFRYESHFVHRRDSLVDILKERGL